jgi:TRAP-type C4-dicarboxylate transport system substrate-binding protein
VRSDWAHGRSDSETQLIRDVAARKADLGWVGSRAWDSFKVRSFRALTAPFLIDSYALQDRVLRSPMARDMLRGIEPLGLVGLGILPGPLRKPLGARAPLVEPADFAGLTIGVQQSRLADATMRALGARPVPFPLGGAIERFDAIEQQIASIQGNLYDATGRYLTANVTLWPRPSVVFANRSAIRSLDPDQRHALMDAAANVSSGQTAATRGAEDEAAGLLCRRGLRFVNASPADGAALRRDAEPVYAGLRRDPATSSFIARIERLRERTGARGRETPKCARPSEETQTAGYPTPVDGTYQMTSTAEELLETASTGTLLSENYGQWRFVLDRGRLRYTQSSEGATRWTEGAYTVQGYTMVWRITDYGGEAPNDAVEETGEVFTFYWSRYRDTLTLSTVRGAISPANFRVKPWRKLE